MTFKKGNKLWNNPNSKKKWFKKGHKPIITEESKRKISLSKIGNKNPQWKGKNVGYNCLHKWIRRHKPQTKFCEHCKEKPSRELANISGEYKRDINDYEWLCSLCHRIKDGVLEKALEGRIKAWKDPNSKFNSKEFREKQRKAALKNWSLKKKDSKGRLIPNE